MLHSQTWSTLSIFSFVNAPNHKKIQHCLSWLIIEMSLRNILLWHTTLQLPHSMYQVTFLEQEECKKSGYEQYCTGGVVIHSLIPCFWSLTANPSLSLHLPTSQQSTHFRLLEYSSSSPLNTTRPSINPFLTSYNHHLLYLGSNILPSAPSGGATHSQQRRR